MTLPSLPLSDMASNFSQDNCCVDSAFKKITILSFLLCIVYRNYKINKNKL